MLSTCVKLLADMSEFVILRGKAMPKKKKCVFSSGQKIIKNLRISMASTKKALKASDIIME